MSQQASFRKSFKNSERPFVPVPSWKTTKLLIKNGALKEKWVRDSGVYPNKMRVKTLWREEAAAVCITIATTALGAATIPETLDIVQKYFDHDPTTTITATIVYSSLSCAILLFSNKLRKNIEGFAADRSPAAIILSRPIATKAATDPA